MYLQWSLETHLPRKPNQAAAGQRGPEILSTSKSESPYQGNRVYDEIFNRRKEFPEAFRHLALIDNGVLMAGKALPMFELYDRREDPWELNKLAENGAHQNQFKRLLQQLQRWSVRTDDR